MGVLERIFKPMTREKFGRRVLRAIRRKEGKAEARFNPADFSISRAGGTTTFLSNAYDEYCRSPVLKRKRVIVFYAAFQPSKGSAIPERFADAAACLLPKVRERFYLEALRLRMTKNDKALDIASRPLNEHLTVELVYDTPRSMALVPSDQLNKWQISFDAAMTTARDNLWKISNENWLQPFPGLHMAPWKDCHAASRLFLHDLIWQLPVKGAHVAMLPNRDALFVAGDQDEAALGAMAALAEEELAKPRFMIALAFRLNGSQWEPFLPPPSSPAYAKFSALRIKSMGQMYAEQKQLIEQEFTKNGDANPPFVASFSGITSPAGELIAFATWAEGVETLLPDADCFAIGARRGETFETLGFIDSAAAHRALGDLLERTDHYPPRWRTTGFPARDRLASIPLSPTPHAAPPG